LCIREVVWGNADCTGEVDSKTAMCITMTVMVKLTKIYKNMKK